MGSRLRARNLRCFFDNLAAPLGLFFMGLIRRHGLNMHILDVCMYGNDYIYLRFRLNAWVGGCLGDVLDGLNMDFLAWL